MEYNVFISIYEVVMNIKKYTLALSILLGVSSASQAFESIEYVCPSAKSFTTAGSSWKITVPKMGKNKTSETCVIASPRWKMDTCFAEIKGNPSEASPLYINSSPYGWLVCQYGTLQEANFARIDIAIEKNAVCTRSGNTATCTKL